jgi:hypothetical protein
MNGALMGMLSLRILCCSQSGHHLENNLAKFDYILDINVSKKSFYILGYQMKLIIKIWLFEIFVL